MAAWFHASLAVAAFSGLFVSTNLSAQADHEEEDKRLVSWDDVIGSGSTFKIYGFLRLDTIYSDSRFYDNELALFLYSEDPAAPDSIRAPKDEGAFTMSPHLTRLGFDFLSPEVDGFGDPDLSANVEVDFLGVRHGDQDAQSRLRMRKAYLRLDWTDWSLVAGQDWDVISPHYPTVNNNSVMWGVGNTGDRRPQLTVARRFESDSGTLSVAGGLAMAGAVASTTVQGSLESGENSGLPMFHSRVGWRHETESGGRLEFGAWGHYSQDRFDPSGGTMEETFDSWSAGVDFWLPLYEDRLWVFGEAWTGENLDDIRGGIFQGVNATTRESIGGTGGFGELVYRATDHPTFRGIGLRFRARNGRGLDAARRAPGGRGQAA